LAGKAYFTPEKPRRFFSASAEYVFRFQVDGANVRQHAEARQEQNRTELTK
jgi:hypothetical protein